MKLFFLNCIIYHTLVHLKTQKYNGIYLCKLIHIYSRFLIIGIFTMEKNSITVIFPEKSQSLRLVSALPILVNLKIKLLSRIFEISGHPCPDYQGLAVYS